MHRWPAKSIKTLKYLEFHVQRHFVRGQRHEPRSPGDAWAFVHASLKAHNPG
jgi:hypothetical protein